MEYIKPRKLKKGDTIAIVSPSWGGPATFTHIYEHGLRAIENIDQVKRMLRNYGTQGVFNQISALLFGRARDYSKQEKGELDQMIIRIVREEFKNSEIPIVTNMDFGHTDPQFILPLGIKAEIDPLKKSFILTESPFA